MICSFLFSSLGVWQTRHKSQDMNSDHLEREASGRYPPPDDEKRGGFFQGDNML